MKDNEDNEIEIMESSIYDDTESYFKSIIDKLSSPENIAMKTDYNDRESIFISAKFYVISKAFNIPLYAEFINELDKRAVSLHRQGRRELIFSLQKREEEIQARQRAEENNI